jgi:hypothetical protein
VFKEICSKVHIGKHSCYVYSIQNGLRKGDILSTLILHFPSECAIRKVHENQDALELNVTQ